MIKVICLCGQELTISEASSGFNMRVEQHRCLQPGGLTNDEWEKLRELRQELEENEARHKEIVILIAKLEQKRQGQAYRFQYSHEHT